MSLSNTKKFVLLRCLGVAIVDMPTAIQDAGRGNRRTTDALVRSGHLRAEGVTGIITDAGRDAVALVFEKCKRNAEYRRATANKPAEPVADERADILAERAIGTPMADPAGNVIGHFRAVETPAQCTMVDAVTGACVLPAGHEDTWHATADGAYFQPANIVTDASYLMDGDYVIAIDGERVRPFTVREPYVQTPATVSILVQSDPARVNFVRERIVAFRARFTIHARPMAADAVCGWFKGCGQPATNRTPHVILGEVFTCDRCHAQATR